MTDVAQVEMAPVEAARRIRALDVLRGLAILGILAVNAPFFAAPWQTALNPTLDPIAIEEGKLWAWFVPHVFFEAKFITLFSLLFGVSLYLVGGERSDKERGKILRRRLGWMLIFGLIHGAAIWYGDILLVYAIAGSLVMFARSWKPATLMTVGVITYALMHGIGILGGAALGFAPPEVLEDLRTQLWSPPAQDLQAVMAGFSGSFIESLTANFNVWKDLVVFDITNAVPRAASVMLIGLALFKWGFFSGDMTVPQYVIIAAIGAAALAAIAYQAQINYASGFDFLHMQSRGQLINPTLSILVTLLYASLLILCVKLGALTFLTNALAPVGQMAFTNYITQSLIMTAIFYGGRGLGLYGEVGRDGLMMIVVAVWVLQLIWSPLWLSRFKMGPLEWFWRRLSYGKPLAIAKPATA